MKLASFLLFLLPVSAFAHAHLLASEPAQNAVLQETPKTVILHFSEALELAMCKLDVKDVETGKVVSEGKPTTSEDRQILQINLTALNSSKKKNQFEVTWRAVAKDTHKINGKFMFSVDSEASQKRK